jgi:hypothetical protein
MQSCGLLIREDLVNKYAEDMVNYTRGSTNSIQDALDSTVDLPVKKDKQEIAKLENKL